MKSKGFAPILILALVAMFILGLPFGIWAGVSPNFLGILGFLGWVVLKFLSVLFFSRLFTWLVASKLVDTTLTGMFNSMRVHVTNQENLSPMFVISGLAVAIGLIFALAQAPTFPLYMYRVLTKGSVGLLVGVVFAAYQARRAGVNSSSSFAFFYNDPGNNQVVAYVMTMFNVAVFLAMLS